MSFTPGPWGIKHTERVSYVFSNTKIADVYSAVFRDTENQHANANLMAAAPELLEACEIVLEYLTRLETGTDESDPLREVRRRYHAPLRAKLEPAIAKALGSAKDAAQGKE